MKSSNFFSKLQVADDESSFDKVKLMISDYRRGAPFQGSVKENVQFNRSLINEDHITSW